MQIKNDTDKTMRIDLVAVLKSKSEPVVPGFFTRVRDYVIDSDNWRFCGVFDSKYNPILWLIACYYATHNQWIYRDMPCWRPGNPPGDR